VRNPSPSLPRCTALGDAVSTPGSSNEVDLGAIELGLLGYTSAPSPLTCWRQVEGGAELACSPVAVVVQLLQVVMAMVD
jgi:hypothetical protein